MSQLNYTLSESYHGEIITFLEGITEFYRYH